MRDLSDVKDMPAEEAWNKLKKADVKRDVHDIREVISCDAALRCSRELMNV